LKQAAVNGCGNSVRNFHAQNAGIIYKHRPHSRMAGCTKESRNRHDSDRAASKFLADAGPLAAIGLSAFKFGHHRTLSLTALRPTPIENHLSLWVSRVPLHQMIVQGRMPRRHDENVAGQACSHSFQMRQQAVKMIHLGYSL
jgi:hypothetical protein